MSVIYPSVTNIGQVTPVVCGCLAATYPGPCLPRRRVSSCRRYTSYTCTRRVYKNRTKSSCLPMTANLNSLLQRKCSELRRGLPDADLFTHRVSGLVCECVCVCVCVPTRTCDAPPTGFGGLECGGCDPRRA